MISCKKHFIETLFEKTREDSKRLGCIAITHEMRQILSDLIEEKKPRKVLEIGSGAGYSGAVICVDLIIHSEGASFTTIEQDEARYKAVSENLGGSLLRGLVSIKCLRADANEWLKQNKETFDFIFIDGPKGKYDLMLPDIVRVLEKGGTMVADNIFFHGMVNGKTETTSGARTIVRHMQQFIEDAKNHKELEVEISDKADGVLVATKK